MAEYTVEVVARTKQTYVLRADSREEALREWESGDMIESENLEVHDQDIVEIAEDDL